MPIPKADKWRSRHRRRGESYVWEKAFHCSCYNPKKDDGDRNCPICENGYIYQEQTMDETWKALVHQTQVDIEDAQFGFIPAGSARISVMPDETRLSRHDRITLIQRTRTVSVKLIRGATTFDALPFPAVVDLLDVRQLATQYSIGTQCVLNDDRVEWLSGGPTAGSTYVVEYSMRPRYFFIGEEQLPRVDKYGALMPQRGALALETMG